MATDPTPDPTSDASPKVSPRGSLPDDAGTDADLDESSRVGEGDLDEADDWLAGKPGLDVARELFGAGEYEDEGQG